MRRIRPLRWPLALLLFPLLAASALAAPTAQQALQLLPVQKGIEIDTPAKDDVDDCEIQAVNEGRGSGWVVRDGNGQTLRRFVDSNGDNKVDLWCYYKEGIEVYRDVDADFNGKADQYRWLGTAGTRWGLDDDEDGTIDSWKRISPEEVTEEVVAALRDRDEQRFQRLVLSDKELGQLRVGTKLTADLRSKITGVRNGFASLAKKQSTVGPKAVWIHFGGGRPGLIPAETDGAEKDLVVYDAVAAFVETDGQHSQVSIGSLVQVGNAWRVIELPGNLGPDTAQTPPGGYFFQGSLVRAQPRLPGAGNLSEAMQKLVADLEKIDQQLTAATTAQQRAPLNKQRAGLLRQLARADADQGTWLEQFADTVSAAVQAGEFPEGVEQLEQLLADIEKQPAAKPHLPYVKFRYLTAQYGDALRNPKADFAKVQEQWLKNLQSFVTDFPKSDDAPEAMLQLAIAEEFAGEEKSAVAWYDRILGEFPKHEIATKAAGGKRRLVSIGKSVTIQGTTLGGTKADLASLKGRVVVVHYWATWCGPCKKDMELLQKLQAKYTSRKLALLGVNCDSQRDEAARYARAERIDWPQLYEPGGLDSRLSNEMGIVTLPTMLLIDAKGTVVNRNLHGSELEDELKKLIR